MFHLGIHASQFCSTMVKGSEFATDCKKEGDDTKEGDDCFFNHRQLQKVFSSKRDLKLNKHDFSQFYKLVAVSITC